MSVSPTELTLTYDYRQLWRYRSGGGLIPDFCGANLYRGRAGDGCPDYSYFVSLHLNACSMCIVHSPHPDETIWLSSKACLAVRLDLCYAFQGTNDRHATFERGR